MTDALVVSGDLSPTADAGKKQPLTMTPEGRLRVDAELSVGDVAITIAEYTEDAAAAANPTGPVTMLVRRDTLVTNEVSAENDNIAWKGTNKGEGRVNDADANAALGTTTGAAVITDANGTIQQYLRGLVKRWADALGVGTGAAALRITQATDDTRGYSAAATFTPAAASHVANDVVGGAQQFTPMGPSAGRIMITSASLEIDGATAEATAWTLYLYNVTPPSATADDGAWDLPSGDRASWLGQIDLGTAVDKGSTQWIEVNGINKQLKLAGTDLFGYLVNGTTLTPAAVAHKVTLHAVAV